MKRFFLFAGSFGDRRQGMLSFIGDYDSPHAAKLRMSFEDKDSIDFYDWAHIFDTKTRVILCEGNPRNGWSNNKISLRTIKKYV